MLAQDNRFSPALRALALLFTAGCATARPVLVAPRGSTAPVPTLFASVQLFDGTSSASTGPMDVLVDAGRIAALGPAGTLSDPRLAAARRVEGKGRTLLPGLIDCHVHLGSTDGGPPWQLELPATEAQAAALVYSGVTTILSAARDTDTAALRRRIEAGELAGPRLLRSSRIFTAEEGHPVPLYRAGVPWPLSSLLIGDAVVQVSTPAAARAAASRELQRDAPDFVKIVYDSIPAGGPHLGRETLAALVATTREGGRRAVVHVGSPQDALEAAAAGASLLMHVPSTERLTDAQAEALAKSGVALVTTVRVWSVVARALRGEVNSTPLERAVRPPGTEEAFARVPAGGYRPAGFPVGYGRHVEQQSRIAAANVLRLRAAGARLLAGTDSGLPGMFHGPALHRELAALVQLGLRPAEVLRMATREAALALDPKADYGAIAVGARADLLLVEGDPLVDIAATERIAGVWQDGVALERR